MNTRMLPLAQHPVPFFSLLLSFALVLLVACCTTSVDEAAARSALNVIADSVDPSYRLAMQGCVDLENLILRQGESGQRTAVSTETELAMVSLHCHRTADAFEEIRTYHTRAAEMVRDGHYGDALRVIAQAREAWRTMQQRTQAR